MSDIEGKATRAGASERGQRTSFKIVCCNFCKRLFLKAAWRWIDRNTGMERMGLATWPVKPRGSGRALRAQSRYKEEAS
jgi:hypothetical protein